MLYVLHIPKTGGSSLRESLCEKYPERVVLGYGKTSVTIPAAENRIWLSHHTYSEKPFDVSPEDVIVFFREPVSRVVSQWAYERREKRRTIRFEDPSLEKPYAEVSLLEHAAADANVQSLFVQGLDLSKAFVGLFEDYSESLLRLNARFNLRLEERRVNVNPNPIVVNKETQDEILRLNAKDLELYLHVKESFHKRKTPTP